MKSNKNFLIVLVTFLVALSLPLGAYEKIKDYLSITTGAVETRILNGDLDPSVSGVSAPIGSEYFRDNGDSFKKVGSFDVDWIRQLNTSTPVGLELMEDPSFEKSVSSYCVSDNTAPFLTSNTSLKSPNNKKGTRINLRESGVTNYTCTMPVSAAYEGTPIRHKGWLTLWSAGNFSCSIVAQWNGADTGNAQIITSSQNIYYDLEVVPTGAGTTGFKLSCDNSTADTTYFVIHDETSNKAEKLSPVIADVKRTQSETLLNVGNLTQTTNLASFSVANDSGVRGIYTKSTAGLTFHQDAQVAISFYDYRAGSTAVRNPRIYLNGIQKSGAFLSAGADIEVSFNVYVKQGQVVTFSSVNTTDTESNIQISATATPPTIVIQNETFNSDINLGAWVAQPNTGTCSSAVIEGEENVGKWTTCSYAINTNTVSGCTTRPTQLDSEARSQGIRIYTRAYNAPSTCGNPALVFLNVGKNFKGFNASLKGSLSLSYSVVTSTTDEGARINHYDQESGIYALNTGLTSSSSNTAHYFRNISGTSTSTDGYLVINASKNPAMSGVNAPASYIVKRLTGDNVRWAEIYSDCWVRQGGQGVGAGAVQIRTYTYLVKLAGNKTPEVTLTSQLSQTANMISLGGYNSTDNSVTFTDGANFLKTWSVEYWGDKTAIQALGVDTSKCQ